MKSRIHYVMPMAGRGSRFKEKGFDFPKPLIEIYGKPFFYWATQSIVKFVDIATLDFVVLEEHIENYKIDKVIYKYYPEARIHVLQEVTEGAVVTCMKGIVGIDDDLPVIFNDCDHLFKNEKFYTFCNDEFDKDIDGMLLTFFADENKYSFVGKDENGNVTRTVEKEVISNEAICGCYYFRNKNVFEEAAKKYLVNCNYSEYFMSGVYNVMLESGKKIKSVTNNFHVPYGVPQEYEIAMKNNRYEELL